MKKISFIIVLLISSMVAVAQDYKVEGNSVVFTKVIEDTGKSIKETHTALEAFFALRYNDVNSTEKLNQQDHLIYKGVFPNVHVYGMGTWAIDVPHVVDVAIKDNRIRVKVTIDEGIIHSTVHMQRYTYSIVEYYPLGRKVERMFKKDAIKAFESTSYCIYSLFMEIENSLQNKSADEEW